MTDFWSTRNGLDTANAIIQISRHLKRIADLLEELTAAHEEMENPPTMNKFSKATNLGQMQTADKETEREKAREAAKAAALAPKVQRTAPTMQFGEMHTIYDSSDSPNRRGKRLGVVTRGTEGWLIEDVMVRLGPHGDNRKQIIKNRSALGNAIDDDLPIQHVARLEPHEKHKNAIKLYFKLLGLSEYFLGYLAADVSDFIMTTSFGEQHTWSDGAKLQVLSVNRLKNHGLRANLLIADTYSVLDEARKWAAEIEETLFQNVNLDRGE